MINWSGTIVQDFVLGCSKSHEGFIRAGMNYPGLNSGGAGMDLMCEIYFLFVDEVPDIEPT